VVGALATDAQDPGFKTEFLKKTISVHPADNGYPSFFLSWEGEGSEVEWHSTLEFTRFPVQVGSLKCIKGHIGFTLGIHYKHIGHESNSL